MGQESAERRHRRIFREEAAKEGVSFSAEEHPESHMPAMRAMARAELESPLAQLGARYLRACGVTGVDEVTPAVADRMLNLAALGERTLASVKKHDNACADGLIAPSEERVRICADVIRAIEELGLMGEVKP